MKGSGASFQVTVEDRVSALLWTASARLLATQLAGLLPEPFDAVELVETVQRQTYDLGFLEGRLEALREIETDAYERVERAARARAQFNGPLPTAADVKGILADPEPVA